MKNRLRALLFYTLCWLIFFISARIIFLLVQYQEVVTYSPGTILGTFFHGFRLDMATTGYLLILPLLIYIVHIFLHGKWYLIFMKIYTYGLIIIFTPLILGDAAIYAYWGFRLEFSVLAYLKNPSDALASASTFQLILFLAVSAAVSALFIYMFRKIAVRWLEKDSEQEKALVTIPAVLIIAAALIVPIRGGFGVAPLNAGSVYFSPKLFPNHAAINIIWNFGHTAVYSKPVSNPYIFSEPDSVSGDFRSLLAGSDSTRKVLNTERPNILLIIIESFGSYLTDISASDSVVTPRFREYIHKGLYFSNFYAAGSRTDKAIPAILSGYPNLPLIQVIREPKKTQSMPGIMKMLDSAGYSTTFWYGGDIDFANLNSYLTNTGLPRKITIKDFSKSECNSKWGAHDDVLLGKLQDSLPKFRQPFACTVLTLSSHEPFEVPMETRFKGEDVLSKFKNSVYYTDRSLGKFLDDASGTEWWKNTLVILLADHCRRNTQNVPVYSQEIFKIPMLWLGGALNVKNEKIEKVGTQFDLPYTIARQLSMKNSFRFSKDLLSPSSSSFAFYTFNEGFAFITDSATAIYDVKMKKNVFESGKDPSNADRMGKSFLQTLYDDYLNR